MNLDSMHSKFIFLLFVIGMTSCLDQKKIDSETELFKEEYLKGTVALRLAEKDIITWKEILPKIKELDAHKEKDKNLLRLEKDLVRFSDQLDRFQSQLKNWNNLDKDFPTMKNVNVEKMSEMRLKETRIINKNITKFHRTGNRVYENVVSTYFTK